MKDLAERIFDRVLDEIKPGAPDSLTALFVQESKARANAVAAIREELAKAQPATALKQYLIVGEIDAEAAAFNRGIRTAMDVVAAEGKTR